MEVTAGLAPAPGQRNLHGSTERHRNRPAGRCFLCVLHVLHADLQQICNLALVGLVHVALAGVAVALVYAIGILEPTAGLPGVAAVHPVEEDAAVSLEHNVYRISFRPCSHRLFS